jgi:hypothetical protein
MEPKTFRSTSVKYATAIKIGTIINNQRIKNHNALKIIKKKNLICTKKISWSFSNFFGSFKHV